MSLITPLKYMGLLKTLSQCRYLRHQGYSVCHLVRTATVSHIECYRIHSRYYASAQRENSENDGRSITKSTTSSMGEAKPVTFKEKVKENTKTTGYGLVMVVGLGVTGIMFYAILRELFSTKSSNSVYTAALERCSADQRVLDALGEPVKGYGEETRRGRRRHVSHVDYQLDGANHMRMKFYLKGIRQTGTVHLDVRENPQTGKYDYRYLFVEVDNMMRRVIVLEDNRAQDLVRSLPELPPLKDYSQPRDES